MDANTTAHAVTHQAALAQSQGVNEGDDRSRVLLARIGEVRRLVAVPVAAEVDQERTAPSQRRLNCGWKQLTGRGALPAMQPKQGGIVARDLDVAEECRIVRRVDRFHADPASGCALATRALHGSPPVSAPWCVSAPTSMRPGVPPPWKTAEAGELTAPRPIRGGDDGPPRGHRPAWHYAAVVSLTSTPRHSSASAIT